MDKKHEGFGTVYKKEMIRYKRQYTSKVDIETIQKKQRNMIDSLRTALTSTKTDTAVILSTLEMILSWLPRQMTPQQYAGIDLLSEDIKVFSRHFYGCTFMALLNNYLDNGILKKSKKHGNLYYDFLKAGYLEESLGMILTTMQNADQGKLETLGMCLDEILKSSCIQQFLLRHCSQARENEKDALDCEETVKLLITLPERVANKLEHLVPESLRPTTYCRIMAYHILQVIFFIADGLKHGISGTVAPIGKLVGKLCYLSDTQAVLDPLTRWLSLWGTRNPIILRISQKVYFYIPDQAKKRFLSSLLKMSKDYKTLCVFLSNYETTCPHTRYHLTEFLVGGSIQNNIEPIIEYLSITQSSHEALRSVFLKLLDLWCDEYIITHSSFDHHINITRGLLICLKYLTQEDIETLRHDAIEKLLPGIAYHLESPAHKMTLVGMVAAEEITKVLHKDGPALKFKYRNSDVLELRQVLTTRKNQGSEKIKEEGEKTDETVWMKEFATELHALNMISSQEKQAFCKEEVEQSSVILENFQNKSQLPLKEASAETNIPDSKLEELDSDDDEFQPYDMSADCPQMKVCEPSYPQEVLAYLIEGEVEKVTAALKVSEKIVRRELKLMDPELAQEIIKVVLHLEDKYDIDGFQENRMNTLSALVVSHPSQCALYLGCEFYERNYNLKQRLDIINTLGRAAIELSGGYAKPDHSLPCITSEGNIRKSLVRNEMKNLAGCFFFPLVTGLNESRPYLDLLGSDRFVLCELLKTLGLIINVTGQCENSLKMVGCLLEVTWSLRSHVDSGIRSACLEALISGLESISDSVLQSVVYEEMVNLREWLVLSIQEDRDEKCQFLSAKLAIRLDKCFAQQINST